MVLFFVITDMRRDVQEIFRNTPHGKQVMMFSATLSKDIRPVCKKFMQDVISTLLLLSNRHQTTNNHTVSNSTVHAMCVSVWFQQTPCRSSFHREREVDVWVVRIDVCENDKKKKYLVNAKGGRAL